MKTISLNSTANKIKYLNETSNSTSNHNIYWNGFDNSIAFDTQEIQAKLLKLDKPCYFVRKQGQIGVTNEGSLAEINNGKIQNVEILTAIPPLIPQQLGDSSFLEFHNVKYAYMTGAMANGIASEELVIALGKENILSSFGAAGLVPDRIEKGINTIQKALPNQPYCFNLIHSPSESAIEKGAVDLYIKYGVTTVEASAFLDLTPNIVYYRAVGLSLNSENQIEIKNKIIAKISRQEIAKKFLEPAPQKILNQLISQGLITELQAKLASQVPMADDITVEADSGGHTDNRPLVCLLPSILTLRDEIQAQYNYPTPVRVGAAGGIGTPQSALAAFMMGAAYVVTGSINQSCLEAGASEYSKKLLAQAQMADVAMAPAADMFEMGVKLQVLKRGTMFGMRSQKLFELYRNYNSIDDIPEIEREKLEKQVFRRGLEEIWQDVVIYFNQRDPQQITRAENNPKRKMALIFRWYLGLSSRWSNIGEKGREIDYQIWCGPSMGAFNNWVKDSYLADPNNRNVRDIAHHIMTGAAYLYRLQNLKLQGIAMPAKYSYYYPTTPPH
ncbi:MAG: PfaD family polyunsaturated fatty acid/polyketide biosynthesis protein [Rivularia sp. (in: cyanobacteria)]